jgi:hypothetical protein
VISIKPLAVFGAVGISCVTVTSTVSAVLASTGGETTGTEAAVIVVTGLASIGGILGALRWMVRAWDRQDPS